MSKVIALYHIVFCTKQREMVIPEKYREDLYRYIWAEITRNKSKLMRIGGIENHLHILIELHPTVPLTTIVRNIKAKSSGWLAKDTRFPNFKGWTSEYYACTLSPDRKSAVINYINNQVAHHHKITFEEELEELCCSANLVLKPGDMT